MVDTSTFFHEATLRICGSLDIQTVIEDTLDYLKDYIPLDGIIVSYLSENYDSLFIFAAASRIPLDLDNNKIIKLSQESRQWYLSHQPALMETVHIYNNPEESPIILQSWKTLGYLGKSSIVLRVMFKEKRIGQIGFFCQGRNRYTKGHADLVRQLYKPFFIALANSLQYQEVVSIKRLLEEDNRSLRQDLHGLPHTDIIGADGGLKDVIEAVGQVAPLGSSVLLLGETGVGKEVIANAIHHASPRGNGPFIKVNCGAIPEGLVNTELFGHEKGAFSGALSRRFGRFELAHGGTIFLDEIGDLPANAQATLLRVLQEKEFWRVGGTKAVKVDLRVIAATHRNLEELVRQGSFRDDL